VQHIEKLAFWCVDFNTQYQTSAKDHVVSKGACMHAGMRFHLDVVGPVKTRGCKMLRIVGGLSEVLAGEVLMTHRLE
jgi:hypothetical protein